ncbi:MAG TPA: hypothetical protein VFS43_01465 [Polyangiaceae bacterium]|nr:hypothetical protein [Polyangiaceae bacterium]
MPTTPRGLADATTSTRDLDGEQYAAWGVIVKTSNVRAVHVANGMMQLLRLMPSPPAWSGGAPVHRPPAAYLKEVRERLKADGSHRLSPQALALCVYKSKAGPLLLEADPPKEHAFIKAAQDHLAERVDPASNSLASGGRGRLRAPVHRLLASVLSADEKVMVTGGADPTTTGLAFVGFSDTHTLSGFHAATFLGLLAATPQGQRALSRFYRAAADDTDPHSSLVRLLGLARLPRGYESGPIFANAYPIPPGDSWAEFAALAGEMASNIAEWYERGATKAEMVMSMVDVALLLLSMRMLRWERASAGPARLLLAVCSPLDTAALHQAIMRARDSLRRAATALDAEAEGSASERASAGQAGGSLVRPRAAANAAGSVGANKGAYAPSAHALNLAAAGGWLFPLGAGGGARRYVCPGPRQLVTLVHALVPPGSPMAWGSFAAAAERVGLALGGADEHRTEQSLRIGSVAATLHEAARANQQSLISLGLARRESDNVVVVDGGAT